MADKEPYCNSVVSKSGNNDDSMESSSAGGTFSRLSGDCGDRADAQELREPGPPNQWEGESVINNSSHQHMTETDKSMDSENETEAIVIPEPIPGSSKETIKQESSSDHSVFVVSESGNNDDSMESTSVGGTVNRMSGDCGDPADAQELREPGPANQWEGESVINNSSHQHMTETDKSMNSENETEATVIPEPIPGSSKETIKQESSSDHSVLIPSLIKSEVEFNDVESKVLKKESDDEEESSEDEVGEEERLDDKSDSEMDEGSEGGAYHLAEVSYGEEDDEVSQKQGGAGSDVILGMSQDHFKLPEMCMNKRTLNRIKDDKGTSVKTGIGKKYMLFKKPPENEVKYFKCVQCSYSTKDNHKLIEHSFKHTVAKQLICPDCNICLKSSSYLREHRRITHIPTPFDCKICGRKCGKQSALAKHMRVHTGEKPFSCTFCSYRSTQQSHLTIHIRKHTGEKPYHCNLCDYKCAYRVLLKKHMLSHTDEKKHECMFCDYKTKTTECLQVHIIKHTGEKPFKCHDCRKRFPTRDAVKRHIIYMHGAKEFFCGICNLKFKYHSSLSLHMKQHLESYFNNDSKKTVSKIKNNKKVLALRQ